MTRRPATLLISGAGGALGLALTRAALARWPDVAVVAIARSVQSARALGVRVPDKRVRIVVADLADAQSTRRAASRIGRLQHVVGIHAAADVAWDKSAPELRGINVDGAINFHDLLAEVAEVPRLIYLSTAYTRSHDWSYRNGYEETKAEAERLLRRKARMPMSCFACSLVVGDSATGQISRFHGIYPMLRFLAEFEPPFLVGRKSGQLDIVALDWVIGELVELCRTHLDREPARDVVASAGNGNRIGLEALVRVAEERINRFRGRHGIAPLEPTPILKGRQWDFLQRSLKAWQPPQLKMGDFRYFERLMSIYGAYSENDRVLEPVGIFSQPSTPQSFMPVVFDHWLDRHAHRLLARYNRGAAFGRPGYERTAS